MAEREGDNLAKFPYRYPPVVADQDPEGGERIMDLVLQGAERSMMDLNLVVQTLEHRAMVEEALWKVVEIVARQGVLPRIIEVDQFGRPVESSGN